VRIPAGLGGNTASCRKYWKLHDKNRLYCELAGNASPQLKIPLFFGAHCPGIELSWLFMMQRKAWALEPQPRLFGVSTASLRQVINKGRDNAKNSLAEWWNRFK
jgi:hypothetical protein